MIRHNIRNRLHDGLVRPPSTIVHQQTALNYLDERGRHRTLLSYDMFLKDLMLLIFLKINYI
ncbi:hypothetical protein ACMD2_15089, partial [Ananas comosus]